MLKRAQIPTVSPAFLLPLIEAFLAAKGKECTATRLGKEAARDPSLIFNLRGGREVRQKTCNSIVDVIENYAPGFAKEFLAGDSDA